MERKTEHFESRVAGVSFRPDSLQKVKGGDHVALIREPSNQFDRNAVMIQSLGGEIMGYIPRAANEVFIHEMVFGRVTHVGRDESKPDSPLGMKVVSYPQLMSPSVSPVPGYQETVLKDMCGSDGWSRLASHAIQASRGCCEVTAAPPDHNHPLELIPVWRIEEGFNVVLVRLALVSHEIASAHRLLDLDVGSREYQLGCQALMIINRFSKEDLALHLTAMKLKRESLMARTKVILPS